jgi:hypothetical protein
MQGDVSVVKGGKRDSLEKHSKARAASSALTKAPDVIATKYMPF